MPSYAVHTHPSAARLPRERQLAWRLAELAADPAGPAPDALEMIANRIIDNAAVAAAALNRRPVANARAQALAHPRAGGATVFGLAPGVGVSPEWAAWANGAAVRELDFHDTFLAAEYAHPADNIPPILAVAQHTGADGAAVARAVAAAYEAHVALAKGICLHAHKIDHIAHLGPSMAVGLGALLSLPVEVTYQAIQHALHVTTTTRQSRKGVISSWKAYAPAFAGKMAVEAVDRAMRGEGAPSPAYEGEDGFIAWLLAGPKARYQVELPAKGQPRQAILETYPKAHAAEYQAQALIDLALRMRFKVRETAAIRDVTIWTSHHTHTVIGSGARDPQKYDPHAGRETLDHSIAYIFAVALEDGEWHPERSYLAERASRPDTVALWRKVRTVEDPIWTRRYHAREPQDRAFGGCVRIRFEDGQELRDELALPAAHPFGDCPFARPDYVEKFAELAEGVVGPEEQARFVSLASRLSALSAVEVRGLTFEALSAAQLGGAGAPGLFERTWQTA